MSWKVALILAIAPSLLAASDPNQVRGFSANQTYQVGELDSVNLNNGNLILRIPIGQVYTVGPSLQYQFLLTYNSKLWDYEFAENATQDCDTAVNGCTLRWAVPEEKANAGFGWTLSLGRLIPPRVIAPEHGWIYVGPDGSEHAFTWIQSGTQVDPNDARTEDSAYLRLIRISATNHEVQFPDGHIASFESVVDGAGKVDVRLSEIRDRFGNWIRVAYSELQWVITDGYGADTARTHYVTFEDRSSAFTQPNFKKVVSSVKLEAFGSTLGAVYSFAYVNRWVGRGGGGERDSNFPSRCLTAPLLETITLPDSTTYQPSYKFIPGTLPDTPPACALDPYDLYSVKDIDSGVIQSLRLPTGGSMEWQHIEYPLNLQDCQAGVGFGSRYMGVGSRAYKSAAGTTLKRWTYTPTLVHVVGAIQKSCEGIESVTIPRPAEEFVNQVDMWSDVTTGTKLTVKNYFSAYPTGGTEFPNFPHNGFMGEEYGLPFTHNNALSGPRFLSSETFDCTTVCQALRRSYVRYEYEVGGAGMAINARTKADRTVNLATIDGNGSITPDTSCSGSACYTDNANDVWDGYGHYGKTVTTSNVPGSLDRTTFVNHTPDASAWLLEKYTDSWVTQGSGSHVTGAKSIAEFDGTHGVLKSLRTLSATGSDPTAFTTSATDLLTALCRSATVAGSRGFVTSERYFGGDQATIPSGDPCSASWAAGRYFLNHGYSFSGAKVVGHSSGYVGVTALVSDVDYEWRTGDVKTSRDSALVATDYVYDLSGRITAIKPTGQAWTSYSYSPGSVPPSATARQCPNGQLTCTTPLTESVYYFDDLGRLSEQLNRTGAAQWSAQWFSYDGMGRNKVSTVPLAVASSAVTSLSSSTPATVVDYDVLGRVTRQTLPDGSKTSWSYTGDHIKTRSTAIWTGVDTNPGLAGDQGTGVSVTEEYDGRGRLIAVTEPSGSTTAANPSGANIRTVYEYDLADRLTQVTMNPESVPVQHRSFYYDGRGFLGWEAQPESGMSSYVYDARGHVREKTQGAANTLFDLRYTYDSAERLTKLEGRNPLYEAGNPLQPAFRVLKEYVFAESNNGIDLRLGKLMTGTRYNYATSQTADVYKIEDLYRYKDAAGRLTDRTTTINRLNWLDGAATEVKGGLTMGQRYDDVGEPTTILYPMCFDCGTPPRDPSRSYTARTYEYGRLKSMVSDPGSGPSWSIINNITFWPNGLRNVLSHGNGVADTQIVGSMPRPTSLQFGIYDRCVHPSFAVQPANAVLSGGSATLSVTMSGTPGFVYEWWNLTANVLAGTTASISVSPSTTTEYEARVANPCGYEVSNKAKVTVGACAAPSTGAVVAEPQPDGSWILRPHPMVGASPTYAWKQLPSSTVIGTTNTLAVAALSSTTTFSVTVSDACGTATTNVTILAPLSITASGLQATATSSTSVSLTWPAVTGATTYHVQRRSGSAWVEIAAIGVLTLTDNAVLPSRTYAYRVYAEGGGSTSNFSNTDVATTRSFLAPIAGQRVSTAPADDMLSAVNSARAALDWPALTWDNILAPTDPVPHSGISVTARQIMSCRSRLNEALQTLGVPTLPYTDADLLRVPVKAVHIREVQERVQ